MKTILLDELITYLLNVTDDEGITYSIVWNKDTHNEEENHYTSIPIREFEIVDEDGEEVEKGCAVWEEIVKSIKETWNF